MTKTTADLRLLQDKQQKESYKDQIKRLDMSLRQSKYKKTHRSSSLPVLRRTWKWLEIFFLLDDRVRGMEWEGVDILDLLICRDVRNHSSSSFGAYSCWLRKCSWRSNRQRGHRLFTFSHPLAHSLWRICPQGNLLMISSGWWLVCTWVDIYKPCLKPSMQTEQVCLDLPIFMDLIFL